MNERKRRQKTRRGKAGITWMWKKVDEEENKDVGKKVRRCKRR